MYEIFEQLLKEKGVTAADVCRATGISQAAISTWKKRRGKLNAENAAKVAAYFGVSVGYLLGEEPEESGYYVYGETAQIAQELFENRDLRLLFDAARDAKPEDLQMAAELIKRMKGTNRDA